MDLCFFVTDLHGHKYRYEKLFSSIISQKPKIVFLGGDLLPSFASKEFLEEDFFDDFLVKTLLEIKSKLKEAYPKIYVIMGNDDPRINEKEILNAEKKGVWEYIHFKKTKYKNYDIYGYSFIPPTPFLLKDWEKYDVSTYVDPGCVHPTEGYRSVKSDVDIRYSNIKKDIELLIQNEDLSKSIFLFHSPPYKTYLDRAALDNQSIDYVPLDVHVGSIAIKRFIEEKQPYITLHGHIHESSKITGFWNQNIKNTFSCSAAIDEKKLAIISFNLQDISSAKRIII